MPTLIEIVSYAKLFRLLRGRRPTARETMQYFSGAGTVTTPMRSYVDSTTLDMIRTYRVNVNR